MRLDQVANPMLCAELWASPQGLAAWLWGCLVISPHPPENPYKPP